MRRRDFLGCADEEDVYLGVVKRAFSELGYVEGRAIVLEHRFPAERAGLFRSMAQEFVDSKPDVIIAAAELGGIATSLLTSADELIE